MEKIALIAMDWGTSNRRGFALNASGDVIAERHDDRGMLALKSSQYDESFTQFAGDWLANAPPALICGMAGSRMGWVEAAYLACPADPADLARALLRAPSQHEVYLVPGLSFADGGEPDVIRGEETKVLGLGLSEGLVLSPGTHPKWIWLDGGRISGFRTYMTGELFSLLATSGTLAQLMVDGPFDAEAFAHGVKRAQQSDLTHGLFSVRTLGLFGKIPPASLRSYLSGLLIGAEIADMISRGAKGKIIAIGSEELVAHYRMAGAMAGLDIGFVPPDKLVASALWRMALAAGLVEGKD